jgi:hypothetical protein
MSIELGSTNCGLVCNYSAISECFHNNFTVKFQAHPLGYRGFGLRISFTQQKNLLDNKEWQGCNLVDMSQPSCKIFLNKNERGGLGFWTIIKIVKESFKEFRRGETNKIGESCL